MCAENAYLFIKRARGAREYNTNVVSKETLYANSRALDVAIDVQAYREWLEEKVKLTAYIPRWLRLALIDYIKQKYGGDVPHGAISEAVSELLAWALEAGAPARLSSSRYAGTKRHREECERILAILKTFILPGARPGSIIGVSLLAKAIVMARGRKEREHGLGKRADPRTIRRWLRIMEQLGYIAQTSSGCWALLWLPDDRRSRELLGDYAQLAKFTRGM